jgi:hypothetical protein
MRKKENKQRGVSFVLPPDEIADLEEIARAKDISVSWFVRQAVRWAMAAEQKSTA